LINNNIDNNIAQLLLYIMNYIFNKANYLSEWTIPMFESLDELGFEFKPKTLYYACKKNNKPVIEFLIKRIDGFQDNEHPSDRAAIEDDDVDIYKLIYDKYQCINWQTWSMIFDHKAKKIFEYICDNCDDEIKFKAVFKYGLCYGCIKNKDFDFIIKYNIKPTLSDNFNTFVENKDKDFINHMIEHYPYIFIQRLRLLKHTCNDEELLKYLLKFDKLQFFEWTNFEQIKDFLELAAQKVVKFDKEHDKLLPSKIYKQDDNETYDYYFDKLHKLTEDTIGFGLCPDMVYYCTEKIRNVSLNHQNIYQKNLDKARQQYVKIEA
jgi:hypothetical protein